VIVVAAKRRSRRPLELRLQAQPESGSVLRAHLRAWLEDVGACRSYIFETLLATTEAFTNAVRHPHQPTRQSVDVKGSLASGFVTISIRDYGTWDRHSRRKEPGGLGLVLIDAVMDDVRVDRDPHGTTVTMSRRLPTA
jgi:serine/threonine-protein kinase RsbW